MGYFSDMAILEAEERLRLDDIEHKRVCAGCFGDPHLALLVRRNADARRCDYCGSNSRRLIAAPLEPVLERILLGVDLEYERADQLLPNDPDIKERMFPEAEFDTREMLEGHVGLELPNDWTGELMEDIAEAMPEQDWCLRDPLGTPRDEAIGNSWDWFTLVVKHRRRFFFLQHADTDRERDLQWGEAALSVEGLLEAIGRYACDNGMVIELPRGSAFWRCHRMVEDDADFGPRRMGPPPYDRATMPNRMSPVGVPMFYGAADRSTALAEIDADAGRFACGRFETLRDVLVLDVRTPPEVPSLFDPERAGERSMAMFMRRFVDDFRAPIDRRLQPHVDYLPTQVATEWFRTSVRPHGRSIEGVLYSSTRDGADAVVLFAENEDVEEGDVHEDRPWLRMTDRVEVRLDAS